mgnify:CR=1 FL=1
MEDVWEEVLLLVENLLPQPIETLPLAVTEYVVLQLGPFSVDCTCFTSLAFSNFGKMLGGTAISLTP